MLTSQEWFKRVRAAFPRNEFPDYCSAHIAITDFSTGRRTTYHAAVWAVSPPPGWNYSSSAANPCETADGPRATEILRELRQKVARGRETWAERLANGHD